MGAAEQETVQIIREAITALPKESQEKILVIAERIRAEFVADPEHGGYALALVGAELAAVE